MSGGRGERGALELRFHFGERDRNGDGPLDAVVMDACARRGVWAAALMRGVEGFGASALVRTERVLSLSEDQPLVAVAVGEKDVIERLAEEVREIAAAGLLTIEEVDVVGGGAVDEAVRSPGDVVRATIWGPRTGPRSPHLRAVDALRRHGADSATVLLGVDGVLDGERRRARFVAANRGVPAVTIAVGERAAISAALAELGTSPYLVTIEGVERTRRQATERLRGSGPGAEAEGVRVTLVTSEATHGGDRPLYLEFIDALRRGGAPGATALRGVWGFRGDVAPHGDRLLALRRDLPLIVEVLDSAERSARWLEVAESVAGGSDGVYSQRIPRILTLG